MAVIFCCFSAGSGDVMTMTGSLTVLAGSRQAVPAVKLIKQAVTISTNLTLVVVFMMFSLSVFLRDPFLSALHDYEYTLELGLCI